MKVQQYSSNQDNLNNGSNFQVDIKVSRLNLGPQKENKGLCKPSTRYGNKKGKVTHRRASEYVPMTMEAKIGLPNMNQPMEVVEEKQPRENFRTLETCEDVVMYDASANKSIKKQNAKGH